MVERSHFLKIRVPYWLVALSLVPMIGGAIRVSRLSTGSTDASNARFAQEPLPILLHISFVALYCLLGAFQFDDETRRRWPAWHRRAGAVVALSGFGAVATGIWMTLSYSIPEPVQGRLLFLVRLAVGAAMATAIVIALAQIVRRNVPAHRAWMLRAYALGQGAGTQVFLLGLPALFVGGEITGWPRDLLMTASWLLNMVLAELIIRRHAHSNARRAAFEGGTPSRALG